MSVLSNGSPSVNPHEPAGAERVLQLRFRWLRPLTRESYRNRHAPTGILEIRGRSYAVAPILPSIRDGACEAYWLDGRDGILTVNILPGYESCDCDEFVEHGLICEHFFALRAALLAINLPLPYRARRPARPCCACRSAEEHASLCLAVGVAGETAA